MSFGYGFYLDPLYLGIMLVTLVISLGAQALVSSAFSRWSKVRNSAGLTGVQVAERLMRDAGLQGVGMEGTPGQHTDHFDPTTNVVRLSQDVATVPSVASMAVIAHELGHAQQYQERSILIAMRSFLVPAMRFSPMVSYGLILMGFFLNVLGLISAWHSVLCGCGGFHDFDPSSRVRCQPSRTEAIE